ncbi:CBS domain-containing protein [Halomonas sp. BC04]|uniref:CBS domain-containing protein n=1 Tax=Halomonas sp. BC04 TaxID=1403540 RepID=UPI0003ED6C28|nr:CBS domain-containing protein [Halomonas sp. BC04]EWH00311.1 hypothetical protein Q427_20260 [Halomonas sp. BC04]
MFESLLIDDQRKVLEALHQLEETRCKILYVTTGDSRLYGSLTDGDVRRWILGGGDLDGLVGEVCNRIPYSTTAGYNFLDVKSVMATHKITSVPVLDDAGRIIDVLFWDSLFQQGEESRKRMSLNLPVVVMAGGKGTRLAPFTSVLPKPLIRSGRRRRSR